MMNRLPLLCATLVFAVLGLTASLKEQADMCKGVSDIKHHIPTDVTSSDWDPYTTKVDSTFWYKRANGPGSYYLAVELSSIWYDVFTLTRQTTQCGYLENAYYTNCSTRLRSHTTPLVR